VKQEQLEWEWLLKATSPEEEIEDEVSAPVPQIQEFCWDSFFSLSRYDDRLKGSGALEGWDKACEKIETARTSPDWAMNHEAAEGELLLAAEALTRQIFDALEAGLEDGEGERNKTGTILSCSTGKDSTLMLSCYLRWALDRKAQGHQLRPILVAMADTGSELPTMEKRMLAEAEGLRNWAQKEGIPLEVLIERPPSKNLLLAEILGNGKPLPRLTSGGSGAQASQWCMSRVKKTPLDAIRKRVREKFPTSVNLLGVRSDESNRRSGRMAHYNQGLPLAIARLGSDKEVGCTPIGHWEKALMRAFLLDAHVNPERLPWRPEGGAELNRMYREAAGPGDPNNPFECQLSITKEGSVSNTCSDLSGTRMGCWMCLLSKNKSLKNIAARRKDHVPLRRFHAYLFGHHKRNFARAKERDRWGHDKKTLVPRGFTFKERFFMTCLLLRAEMESGIKLLSQELEDTINHFWEKSGIFLTVETARQATEAWKKTGRSPTPNPEPWDQEHWEIQRAVHQSLGCPLPPGTFWEPDREKGLSQKLPSYQARGLRHGHFPWPTMETLILRCHAESEKDSEGGPLYICLVTDTPSTLSHKTGDGTINGLLPSQLTQVARRPLTPWEKHLSNGRTLMYQWRPHAKQGGDPRVDRSTNLANAEALGMLPGGEPECANWFEIHWTKEQSAAENRPLSAEEFTISFQTVQEAAESVDWLEEELNLGNQNDTQLEATGEGSKEWKERMENPRARKAWESYRAAADGLGKLFQSGMLKPALAEKMAYIARTNRYDPKEAEDMMLKLCRQHVVVKNPQPPKACASIIAGAEAASPQEVATL
jgi:3'-phosphoadenosine 5'-phosphosulfate sulfotransferase (PAPS reductase)/FAD synthetase